ncbi:MAG TPA: methionyl-tRNA formyltransferase [Candidatus Acidoferrales bacterium]|jgi:methionyl-tRNA formyltransferase|nr:methionyl-tRNA formyltransferase [Candidatus Acidoferrales bacterium]
MRIVFCGTPEFATPTLRRLLSEPDFTIEAVVTQPDRPRGRGRQVTNSAVKEVALDAGLYLYQPETAKSDSAYGFFQRLAPDAVVIIAYGQIIPARLIALPPLGWINLHASLLPKYRGAAPINWAIINGERRTGLTTMQIDAGLDTGPILLQQEHEIGADETAPELSRRLAEAGAPLMLETLRKLGRGELTATPQEHAQATLAPMLKKEDGRVNWLLTAQQIYNRIRGLDPWPGAFTAFRGQLCRIWGRPAEIAGGKAEAPGSLLVSDSELYIACGQGTRLRLEAAQLEGRKRISARDFANGAHVEPGERFGS